MSDHPKLSIVTPAYNEAESLPVLVDAVAQILRDAIEYEIIIVNDGSADETVETMERLSQQYDFVHYINFSRNYGHQAALKAGLIHARGDCVVVMDADLQHPPKMIPAMVEQWRKGHKLVLTKRMESENQGFFKKLTSRYYYKIINLLADTALVPGMADFYLLDRQVVDTLKTFDEGRWFLRGMLPGLGFKKTIIDYTPAKREYGESQYTVKKMITLAVDGVLATSMKPLRFGIVLAMIVASFSIIYACYALYVSVVLGSALPGWTSVMFVVTVIGAMQLFMLGIIGEYLGRTLSESRGRPDFIIESTTLDNKEIPMSEYLEATGEKDIAC